MGKSNQLKAVISLFILTIVTVFGTSLSNIAFFTIKDHITIEGDNSVYIKLFDQLRDEDLSICVHNNLKRKNLMQMVEEMSNQKNYLYYEMINQPLLVNGAWFPQRDFLYTSEQENESIQGNSISDNTWIKAIQLSQNSFDLFGLSLEEGNLFDNRDFTWKEHQDSMKCLVGYNYSQYLSIGDKFCVTYLNQNIEMTVIGILKPYSAIRHYNKQVILDNSLIMPAANVNFETNSTQEAIFQVSILSQKVNGLYKLDDSAKIGDFILFIRNLEDKYGFPSALLSNVENKEKAILIATKLNSVLESIMLKTTVIILDLFMLLSITLILTWLKNKIFDSIINFIRLLILVSVIGSISVLQYFLQAHLFPGLPYSIVGKMFIAINTLLPLFIIYNSQINKKREEPI